MMNEILTRPIASLSSTVPAVVSLANVGVPLIYDWPNCFARNHGMDANRSAFSKLAVFLLVNIDWWRWF